MGATAVGIGGTEPQRCNARFDALAMGVAADQRRHLPGEGLVGGIGFAAVQAEPIEGPGIGLTARHAGEREGAPGRGAVGSGFVRSKAVEPVLLGIAALDRVGPESAEEEAAVILATLGFVVADTEDIGPAVIGIFAAFPRGQKRVVRAAGRVFLVDIEGQQGLPGFVFIAAGPPQGMDIEMGRAGVFFAAPGKEGRPVILAGFVFAGVPQRGEEMSDFVAAFGVVVDRQGPEVVIALVFTGVLIFPISEKAAEGRAFMRLRAVAVRVDQGVITDRLGLFVVGVEIDRQESVPALHLVVPAPPQGMEVEVRVAVVFVSAPRRRGGSNGSS